MKSALGLGLVLAGLGFLPLMGGPRYEAALLAGLIGPGWVAVASALRAHEEATQSRLSSALDDVRRNLPGPRLVSLAFLEAVVHGFVVLGVAALHGLISGFCEPEEGFALFVLGPVFGMTTAALWGAIVGGLWALGPVGRRWTNRLAVAVLAVGMPLFSASLGVLRFYLTPAVFAYDPFVGYFAGPLYDTVQYDIGRILSYRVGTLATWGAVVGALSLVAFRFEGKRRAVVFVEARKDRIPWLVLTCVLGLASVAHTASAESLSHASSSESIRHALGRTTQSGPCRIHFSTGIDETIAMRTAQECEGHLPQLEAYFGVESGGPVDVFLFASSEEKRFYMGAASTYIAKPWRREIYILPGAFPHQVLGHELAHVVAGQFGQGPFRVAGPLGGWFPDPGRIEGFAVAASPREDSEGTLHEWTAAMRRLDLLPPLGDLFQLSFLKTSAARSYSAAGSFVDYVHRTHGAETARAWYGGADLPRLLGQSWSQIEADFHAFLDGIEVPVGVMEIAKPRFSRPGVFERRCPHAVDRATSTAMSLCSVHEERARTSAREAIELDPTQVDLELQMARCAWHAGDPERSEKELSTLAADEVRYEPSARRAAWDFAGDIAWQRGDAKTARSAFEEARKLTFDRDGIRQLEVKMWAIGRGDTQEQALRLLLAPKENEAVAALAALVRWGKKGPNEDLAKYLLARAYVRDGASADAQRVLGEMDRSKLPLASLVKEAGRMEFLLACETRMRGHPKASLKAAFDSYTSLELTPAETFEAKRLLDRCETVALRKTKPSPSLGK